jgi:hypothetical protein
MMNTDALVFKLKIRETEVRRHFRSDLRRIADCGVKIMSCHTFFQAEF